MKYNIKKDIIIDIDQSDIKLIEPYNWLCFKDESGRIYFGFQKQKNNFRKVTLLHRFIMNCPDDLIVDHIDGNTLDNRKSKLRICTPSQNCQNSHSHKDSKSRFKGVSWKKHEKSWQVEITSRRKRHYIGFFKNEIEAAIAYDNAAKKYHGEYAKLNFNEG